MPLLPRAPSRTVEQVLKTYDGKIRYVFRDYPLPFHRRRGRRPWPRTAPSRRASSWSTTRSSSSPTCRPRATRRPPADLGLDQKKFDECVAKNDQKSIDKDIADGGAVGVNGTPAFFINGRMLSGAQPFEAFKVDHRRGARAGGPEEVLSRRGSGACISSSSCCRSATTPGSRSRAQTSRSSAPS